MLRTSFYTIMRIKIGLLLAIVTISILGFHDNARAHFSYSDPRIVHVAEYDKESSVIMIRMPAPLALLPDDWKGQDESRVPPFGMLSDTKTVVDLSTVAKRDAAFRERLSESVALWVGGKRIDTRVGQYSFWSDNARPKFGTLKSASSAFEELVDRAEIVQTSYFDLTLDVELVVPVADLNQELRLESNLGRQFRVMDKLGTVIKLHRNNATETRAAMGLLNVSFPRVVQKTEMYLESAWTGAEHIYRGLDHLAMIVLIAIAATGWRQALFWASAFTVGHMTTLVAGLYGFTPVSPWFVPMIELAIALSIVVTGFLVFLKRRGVLGWAGLLFIGLIHGYGFAASASEAFFSGQFDPINLASFALGLEFCQFAVYALVLPMILHLDRMQIPVLFHWRRVGAIGIAISACVVVVFRFSEASKVFGVI